MSEPASSAQRPAASTTSGGLHWAWRRLMAAASSVNARFISSLGGTDRRMARGDVLTGLTDRLTLRDRMVAAVSDASRNAVPLHVFLIDLDRFKPVNERHGQSTGDRVLATVAGRIAASLAPGEICARYGGDEFVILVPTAGTEALARAARLIEMLSLPVAALPSLGDQVISVSASIGIAAFPEDAETAEELMHCAELALDQAKNDGRGTVRVYRPEMRIAASLRLTAEDEIRSAIADGQIIPYFQPIVDVATRRIRGFEALARWQHPSRGLIAPVDFIGIAEAAGEIGNLTMSMLRQACTVVRDLPPDLTIAINITPQQLQDEWLSSKILQVLTETGLPPHRLEVELTENALVSDFTSAKRIIQSLQNVGISVALDDFGTGYSSLFYLSELQFDKIKIDRSFVRTLHDRTESVKIVNAIVGLGRSLGVPTMAEGVETELDAEVLTGIGCLTAQGYLYSRPVPADQLADLLVLARAAEIAA